MKLRTLLALALLAPAVALAAPASGPKSASKAPPSASPASSPSSPGSGLEFGGFIGYETDDLSGLALRVDGELPFQALSPAVNLSWVGSIGYSHLTWDPVPYGSFTANVLKLVPAARFTLPLNPQFSVFGDVGLGLAYISATTEFSPPGFPSQSFSDSSLNIMMRLGVGAWYHVNPQLKLGAMLEFDPVFGDYAFSGANSQSFFQIQVGAMFRL